MKLLFVFLAALALAVLLGQGLSGDHGTVVVQVGGYLLRARLSVAVMLGLVAAGAVFFLLRNLWRLLTLRRRVRRWRALRAQRTSQTRLAEGVLALSAGDFAKAERLLAAPQAAHATAAHFLAAAQAAQALEAPARRDDYLARAAAAAPRQALAITLQRVEMQLAAGELANAGQNLAGLARRHQNHPQVLGLQHRLLVAREAWDEILTLLPRLRRAGVYPIARLEALEIECAARLLSRPCATAEAATELWERLPRAVRSQAQVLEVHARILLALGAHTRAEELLRGALRQRWEPRLIAPYGEVHAPAAAVALAQAEHWAKEHPEDPVLLLALGRLCLTEKLWGKARSYLEAALARAPGALAHRLLADALDQLGEPAAAARERRLGLELVTGAARPALPAP